MSRYEQDIKNNFSAKNNKLYLILGVIIIALIGLFFLFLQKNKAEDAVINQVIEIPKQKIEQGEGDVEKSPLKQSNKKGNLSNEIKNGKPLNVLSKKLEKVELDESDAGFKKAVENVSKEIAGWFDTKDVIRKYVILIHDISQNQMLAKNRQFIQAPKKNIVKGDKRGLYLSEEGYERYDDFANAIVSIDIQKGRELYLAFKPLFNKVYQEFSYPDGYTLEDIFLKAASNVINAPIKEGRVSLVKHSLYYKFADKKLEALGGVEKQMLRMGPRNTKKIQAKLRQLVEAISGLE